MIFRIAVQLLILGSVVSCSRQAETAAVAATDPDSVGIPLLLRKIEIPSEFQTQANGLTYGGDIRLGDLNNDQQADFLVYRTAKGDLSGASKPCFIGAFDANGKILWQVGEKGGQPNRPGPMAITDIDNDGQTEVICLFRQDTVDNDPFSMSGVDLQIRNGINGEIERSVDFMNFGTFTGKGPNWVHQRIFVANFTGTDQPQDFIIKMGKTLLAFDHQLNLLWRYFNPNDQYQNCPAYIPAVGDIDGNGKDEVNGGYYLLDHQGKSLWEQKLGKNMDAVAITKWDNGKVRAFGSGYGHILDKQGNIILKLGAEIVPHGQEMQIADFTEKLPGPEMIIRYNGHQPDVMLVDNQGQVVKRFVLNESPNNTGMTTVYWNNRNQPALLFNGGILWNGDGEKFAELRELPPPQGDKRAGWYHCIPADIYGDPREEIITYNPWDHYVFVYTPYPQQISEYQGYNPGPRQYNVRLMD